MPNVKEWAERTVTLILVLCALAVTTMIARREFLAAPAAVQTRDASWRAFIPDELSKAPDRPITIITFSDYQCPACCQLAGQLQRLVAEQPERVRVIRRHLPLPQHAFALPAAHASECARLQARFERLDSLLYADQDSIGHRPWSEYARMAGVPDLPAFDNCMTHNAGVDARIERDVVLAQRAAFTSTPTVFINSIHLSGAPSDEELARLLRLADPRPE